jgi:predicted RNase H-like HicB family nuclease
MAWRKMLKSLTRRKSQAGEVYPGSVLTVIYEQGEDGYIVAECPQLPGCMSQGKTKLEASRNIRDAIRSVLIVRLGQFVSEGQSSTARPQRDTFEEEKLQVKGPDLISV